MLIAKFHAALDLPQIPRLNLFWNAVYYVGQIDNRNMHCLQRMWHVKAV